MTTCRLWLTVVSGLDHHDVLTLAFRSCLKSCFQFRCALRSHGLVFNSNRRLVSYKCEITTNIKHVLPAPLLETSTFSGVSLNSLKTLLVFSHRRVLRPSPQLAWRIGGSPNLIIASCNSLRQSSRPHHCLPQWFRGRSVCGRPPGQPQRCSVSSCKCSRKVDQAKCNRLRRSDSSFMTLGAFFTSRNVSS